MIALLDVAERVQKGPKMEEKDWDLSLYKKMGELSRKHGLRYPGGSCYNNLDDSVVEGAFQAAFDFLVEMGIYCVSTRRIIEFDEKELSTALNETPKEVIVGEGRDQRTLRQKEIEGKEALNQCPGLHAPFTEELGPMVVKNYAQIVSGDYVGGFNFTVVDGRKIFGPPMEVYAARREVALMREGVRRAGRPGMGIVYYPINTRAATLIAPMDPDFGLRRTDGIALPVIPGVKIEQSLLTAAIVYENYGSFKTNSAAGMLGGFCGGAEGAIIEGIVRTIGGWLSYKTILSCTGVYDMRVTTAKRIEMKPEKLWAHSVVLQALNTRTNTICFGDSASQSGPGTETHLIELGINTIQGAVNGANLFIARQALARMNASQTPLESEFVTEVANATIKAGVTRKEANKIIKKLAEKIEGREVENGPDDIRECYDLVHHRPTPEYERMYLSVKKEFRNVGIPV